MRNLFILCCCTLVFSLCATGVSDQPSADAFEEKPSWEEHFNGKGYSSERDWTASETYTKEHLVYYVKPPHNVYVKRGKLYLVLRKNFTGTNSYTSGRVISKRTFSCGKLEFRAKCLVCKGVWNAIWLRDASKERCRGR